MGQLVIYIAIYFIGFINVNTVSFKQQVRRDEKKFRLNFVTVGFGSNMFEMEPVFKVDGTKFIYTSEEVWIFPRQTKIQKDTLLQGDFRISSIDSISTFICQLKESAIHKSNMSVMSGSACYIEILDDIKKINFQLHNTSDTTADKIVSVLNTYIPTGYNKLYISNIESH